MRTMRSRISVATFFTLLWHPCSVSAYVRPRFVRNDRRRNPAPNSDERLPRRALKPAPSSLHSSFLRDDGADDHREDVGSVIDSGSEIAIHDPGAAVGVASRSSDDDDDDDDPERWKFWQEYRDEELSEEDESWLTVGLRAAQFRDLRRGEKRRAGRPPGGPSNDADDTSLRVGSVVIPLLSTRIEGVLPEFVERPIRILVSTLFSATVLGGSWVNVPTSVINPHRSMWEKGVYPGVDYRITRIVDRSKSDDIDKEFNSNSDSDSELNSDSDSDLNEERDIFRHRSGADYEMQPLYPLGSILERRWPVRINEAEIPNLISPLQYNIATAIGALTASASIFVTFFVISLATSLFFIPSRSMEPTLDVGDVLLVEKITPRLPAPLNRYRPGDVVMFHPPSALRDLVEANGGRLSDRDLFVKRVAAVAGDVVEVERDGNVKVFNYSGSSGVNKKSASNGVENREAPLRNLCGAEPLGLIKKYIKPGVVVVPSGKVLLLGDCSSVSVDGRVWGTLDTGNIVGRPLVRTWPVSKISKIPDLPTVRNR